MTWLDIVIIGIVGVSVAIAFLRGCVREVLTIGAWVGAALLTPLLMPFLIPYARDLIAMRLIADLAAGGVIFLTLLVGLTFLCHTVSRLVQASALSPVDRSLGAVFGALRGLVIVCAGYLLVDWAISDREAAPGWFAESHLVPMVASVSDYFVAVATGSGLEPAVPDLGLSQPTETAQDEKASEPPAIMPSHDLPSAPETPDTPKENEAGYAKDDRQDLDRLFETAN